MAHAQWAADIRSIERGESIYTLNAGKLMMPASNMKILTLASAAEVLGWESRMTTTLEAASPVVDGVLRGDLFVRGGGDPTINSRDGRGGAVFSEWVTALKAAGISTIEGRIVGDDQAFDDEGFGPGWAWDDLQYGYSAPVGALQFNEDVAELLITPASPGEPAMIRLGPGSGLTVVNRAVTGPPGSEESIDYRRHLDRPVLEITGTIPSDGKPLTRTVAVVNPTVFFARSLKDALAAHGISVGGEAVDFDDVAGEATMAAERRVLASTASPPLSEMAKVLMKVSQNLYAETFLKAVGRATGGLGTTAAGRQAATTTFASWGVSDRTFVMADGSGLSRYNYASASTIATILERMYKDPRHRDHLVASLPIAGKDGTLSTRMRRSLAEGNAVAKTGSISNVRALSGFVRTRDGETFVFSIIANDFVIPSATVNWIADLAVEVLADFSRQRPARPSEGSRRQ
jgi:D-alanyl-D-alanine carboxypeptidase/D-alanyl-D-alanine-endopeptidase (penicillin-binding protein 4)